MEIEFVKEFITLARLENFLDASEELYISQSTLSKHIKSIELELNVPLFDRTTRKVKLNRYGREFLIYAEKLVEISAQAQSSLSELSHTMSDMINLAVIPSFIAYNFQNKITSFQKKYPDYPVHLTEGSNDQMLKYLQDGTCNLAFMRITEEVGLDYAVIPYVEDHLILAVPHGHPLDDGRTSVRIEDLQGYPLMSTTSPTQQRTIHKLCEECGVKLNMVATLSRSDVIVEMIRNGFGCAFLQEYPTRYYFGDSIVRLPVEPSANNTMAIVYIKSRPLSLAMRSFIRIVFPDGITGGIEV